MLKFPKSRHVLPAVLLCLGATAAWAGPRAIAYSGLDSHDALRPNPQDRTGHTPLAYGGPVNWRRYHSIIIDPVTVYDGPDAQFGKIPDRGQAYLAGVMQETFTQRLARDFEVSKQPAAGTLRLHLTLTGASATPPVIGTLTHVDIAGGLYNTVQGVRGGKGMISGAVVYSAEIYDATTGELLRAQVSRQYPNAMNIAASLGPMKAARIGLRKGADELARQLTRNETDVAPGRAAR